MDEYWRLHSAATNSGQAGEPNPMLRRLILSAWSSASAIRWASAARASTERFLEEGVTPQDFRCGYDHM